MGEVFRAWDYRLDRQVALKIPLEASARVPQIPDRFRIEVEAVERLNHENLCKLLDHDVHHVPPFLTMEFLEGGSLEDRADEFRESPAETVLEWSARWRWGSSMHTGMGSFTATSSRPTCSSAWTGSRASPISAWRYSPTGRSTPGSPTNHQILGSLLYMAPEQIEGPRDAIDKPTDVYALGIMMFRLLTGGFPYANAIDDWHRYAILQEIRAGLTRGPVVAPSRPRWPHRRDLPAGDRAASHRDDSRR